ncbi:MAG TPA: hypothetical protein DEF00_05275 [Candidatus Taylorbacteria bacterium]|nr:MAG: hypothetical protein UY03_C0015G0022 [Parcubacteria group bacterium GW2011_GWA2_47_64]KKU97255.1 MAG: hypothetical protein UY29_C0001G0049 [Parcubacteria group bacterium GW2011_GWC2_48_17]HBV01759.1 hypothetical protein [Candidatus Taylorbacteria bacterium]
MKILPLHSEIVRYIKARGLLKRFEKQSRLFVANLNHPSLEMGLLEPRHLRIFSFRLNRKYRAIFIFQDRETIEVIDINNHYQ